MVMPNDSKSSAGGLKEEGNQHFQLGDFERAAACYTEALRLPVDNELAIVLHRNRAQCRLKLASYDLAIADCDSVLDKSPNDPKALFRRALAAEALGRVADAYRDAAHLFRVDPTNSAVQPLLRRLQIDLERKREEAGTTQSKVKSMVAMVMGDDIEADEEKRVQCLNNLTALCKTPPVRQVLWDTAGLVPRVLQLATKAVNGSPSTFEAGVRFLTAVVKDSAERSRLLLDTVSVQNVHRLLVQSESEVISRSAVLLLKVLVSEMTGLEDYKQRREKAEEERKRKVAQGLVAKPLPQLQLSEEASVRVDAVLKELLHLSHSSRIQAFTRDSVLELLIILVNKREGITWYKQFLGNNGVETILEVTCAFHKGSHEHLKVSSETRRSASVLLAKVYEDLTSDQLRQAFRESASSFVMDLLCDKFYESKIESLNALSALLEGPHDIAQSIIGSEGILEGVLLLAQSSNDLHQRLALETLVLAISKKSKCDSVLRSALPVLQKMYTDGKDAIKVRALVGLCKLGTSGGTDSSSRSLAEGSNLVLARSCRRFLTNEEKDLDLRRWAVEGLAYLCLDAEVKEEMCDHAEALQALIDLALRSSDPAIVYPCASVLVNLTNSYDKQDVMPELVELAKFAKHHVPEEHPKDAPAWVEARIAKLVRAGMLGALAQLTGMSEQAQVTRTCRELLSRVFVATLTVVEHRGPAVACGAAKALLSLANGKNTDGGQGLAAQALARLAISLNPETAFPGQRAAELVRPLNQLLHVEANSLQVYETLLALTNLASVSDSLRSRVLSEVTLARVRHYMYDDHRQLRRASVELLCNLCLLDKVVDAVAKAASIEANEDLKLLLLYCSPPSDPEVQQTADAGADNDNKLEPLAKVDDSSALTKTKEVEEEEDQADVGGDERLLLAASGALAYLSARVEVVGRLLSYPIWADAMSYLASYQNPMVSHRGLYILRNMCACGDKDLTARIAASPLLEILMAVSRLADDAFAASRHCAKEALDCLAENGHIRPSGDS